MPKMTLREAISFGLTEALDNDSDVFLMGEDVGKVEGSYAVSKGFYQFLRPWAPPILGFCHNPIQT